MNVLNGAEDGSTSTNNTNNEIDDHPGNKVLTSSPPSTPPSTELEGAHTLDEHLTSSSPNRRPDINEQPIIIAQEFLQSVIAMVESLGPRRVKVYELRGEVWVDLGTGFCQGFVENVTRPPCSGLC
jgi:hypothetical protein